jgi:hypothetical protein
MSGQGSAALWLWSSTEFRRRWASLVMLGLLAGVASGLAIAAFDGAARSSTAYTRMRARLAGADAIFYPSQARVGDADVSKLGSLDEVAAWAGFALNNSHIDELGDDSPLITVGDGWFNTIERAKVLEGRLPNPTADDEVVINGAAANAGTKLGLHVGSVLTWRNLSPDEAALHPDRTVPEGFDWTTAKGPVTKLHIVGVVHSDVADRPRLGCGAPRRDIDLFH